MSDSMMHPAPQAFNDLVPWADPYIVALVRKLQRETAAMPTPAWPSKVDDELPPPLPEPDFDSPLLPHVRQNRLRNYTGN